MKEMSKLSKFGRIIMVLTMVLSVGLSLFNNPLSASAAEDGKITVHKKQFDTETMTGIKNTGKEMDDFDTLANVEGATFGVGAVTADDWDEWKAAGGTYDKALEIYNRATTIKETTVVTGTDGIAAFTGLSTDKMYLVIELAPLASGITAPSAPIFINVPYSDGNKDIHLYPKNQYTKGDVIVEKTDQNEIDPVNGAVFELFKVADPDDISMGTFTTVNGKFTIKDLLVGDYYLVETQAGDGYYIPEANKKIEFSITPGDFADGNITLNINNPKIPVKTPVDGEMSDVGDVKEFEIKGSVPAKVGSYEVFRFVDTLDEHLRYVAPVTAKAVVRGEEATNFIDLTGFTAVLSGEDATDGTGGKVTIDFTTAGKTALQNFVNANAGKAVEILISLKAEVVSSNPIVIAENNIDYIYGNEANPEEIPGTPVKVYTGGKRFIKVDDKDNPLAGAKFKVYKLAPNGTDKLWYGIATNGAGEQVVSWYPGETDAGVTEVTTGADGLFEFTGLDYGTYYLHETVAPTGKKLLSYDPDFEVTKTSYDTLDPDTNLMPIVNSEAPELPITGGMGTVLFALVGIMLMGGAYMFYRKSKTA